MSATAAHAADKSSCWCRIRSWSDQSIINGHNVKDNCFSQQELYISVCHCNNTT